MSVKAVKSSLIRAGVDEEELRATMLGAGFEPLDGYSCDKRPDFAGRRFAKHVNLLRRLDRISCHLESLSRVSSAPDCLECRCAIQNDTRELL